MRHMALLELICAVGVESRLQYMFFRLKVKTIDDVKTSCDRLVIFHQLLAFVFEKPESEDACRWVRSGFSVTSQILETFLCSHQI